LVAVVTLGLGTGCIPRDQLSGAGPGGAPGGPAGARGGVQKGASGTGAGPLPASAPAFDANDPDVRLLVKGLNEFAFDMYKEVAKKEKGNIFISPLNIYSALAMTYGGARGKTAEEMERALHIPPELLKDNGRRLHAAMGRLTRALNAEKTPDGKPVGYALAAANSLWAQKGYPFRKEYFALTREAYGAELQEVDFIREPLAAVEKANAWVSSKTRGMIPGLLSEDSVDRTTRLVLASAIYFKGDWARQFDRGRTVQAPFRRTGDKAVNVPMMSQTAKFPYQRGDSYSAICMPYVGGDLTMEVYLPDEVGDAGELVQLLERSARGWRDANSWRDREVDLYFPRFKSACKLDLIPLLTEMGVRDAFLPRADFSGMAQTGIVEGERLYVRRASHGAVVDVNEEGTEAAAATGLEIVPTAAPRRFWADRPFIFVIRDARSGCVLFLGRLSDPKAD
jgi:serpin B